MSEKGLCRCPACEEIFEDKPLEDRLLMPKGVVTRKTAYMHRLKYAFDRVREWWTPLEDILELQELGFLGDNVPDPNQLVLCRCSNCCDLRRRSVHLEPVSIEVCKQHLQQFGSTFSGVRRYKLVEGTAPRKEASKQKTRLEEQISQLIGESTSREPSKP